MKLRNVREDPRGGYGCSAGVTRAEYRKITGHEATVVRELVEVHLPGHKLLGLALDGVDAATKAKIEMEGLWVSIQLNLEEAGGGAIVPRSAVAR